LERGCPEKVLISLLGKKHLFLIDKGIKGRNVEEGGKGENPHLNLKQLLKKEAHGKY